jgi:drug/metabolite transporter (DMT)-like permease
MMVFATLLMAGTTLLAKAMGNGAMGQSLHTLMISQGRFVFGFAVVALVLLLGRASGRAAWPSGSARPNWVLHATRTALGWSAGVMMFAAAARMPLADANALGFTSPVATMLFAIPFLGERPGRWRWLAAGLAMLGAFILLRPGADVIQPAALLALGAAIAMGLEAIAIKRLAVSEPPGRTMLINNAMGAVISSIIAFSVFTRPETVGHWLALVGIGAMMVCVQILNLQANRRADASFVAPFFYLTLVWAALFDLLVFDVWPDAISIMGASIIVAGGLLMTWREMRRQTAPIARL